MNDELELLRRRVKDMGAELDDAHGMLDMLGAPQCKNTASVRERLFYLIRDNRWPPTLPPTPWHTPAWTCSDEHKAQGW